MFKKTHLDCEFYKVPTGQIVSEVRNLKFLFQNIIGHGQKLDKKNRISQFYKSYVIFRILQ